MSPLPQIWSALRNSAGGLSSSTQPFNYNDDSSRYPQRGDSTSASMTHADTFIQNGFATETASWPIMKRDMSTTKIVGLSMILAGILFFLAIGGVVIWIQRRRLRRADTPPPVPEKDYPLESSPTSEKTEKSQKRSSRIFNMAAFTTPIHGEQKREASVIGQSPDKKSAMHGPKRKAEAKAVRLVVPEESDVKHVSQEDSPVDGSSPFRLSPDNGVKRLSLGTEISKVWPQPPPAIWTGTPEGATSPQRTRTRIVPSRKLTDTEAEIIGLYSRSWYLPADYETSR